MTDRILPKRLAVAIKEGLKHKATFDVFTQGLKEHRPEEVAGWKAWVLRWEAKQHTDAKESPFELAEEGTLGRSLIDAELTLKQ
jgi:hypothetical protein